MTACSDCRSRLRAWHTVAGRLDVPQGAALTIGAVLGTGVISLPALAVLAVGGADAVAEHDGQREHYERISSLGRDRGQFLNEERLSSAVLRDLVEILPRLEAIPVPEMCGITGLPENEVRDTARLIARAPRPRGTCATEPANVRPTCPAGSTRQAHVPPAAPNSARTAPGT